MLPHESLQRPDLKTRSFNCKGEMADSDAPAMTKVVSGAGHDRIAQLLFGSGCNLVAVCRNPLEPEFDFCD
jgi:hypothetical protein